MSFLDTLTPRTVEIKGARKILNMTGKDDAEDKAAEETELTKFLRRKYHEEKRIQKRMDAIRAMKIRKLRDAAKRAKVKWDRAVKELEQALTE
jgi:Asp-tRNA(Asn)/Glu-tRNA(Gln) amidotransferase A subunit family amidase